jgi:hypothetical protein
VPSSLVTEDGFPLGQWLVRNRVLLRAGTLDADRAARLKAFGVAAETRSQAAFQRGLDALDAYITENGHARVPRSCVAPDGYRLGSWLGRQRGRHSKTSAGQPPLTAAEAAALDKRGVCWSPGIAAGPDPSDASTPVSTAQRLTASAAAAPDGEAWQGRNYSECSQEYSPDGYCTDVGS